MAGPAVMKFNCNLLCGPSLQLIIHALQEQRLHSHLYTMKCLNIGQAQKQNNRTRWACCKTGRSERARAQQELPLTTAGCHILHSCFACAPTQKIVHGVDHRRSTVTTIRSWAAVTSARPYATLAASMHCSANLSLLKPWRNLPTAAFTCRCPRLLPHGSAARILPAPAACLPRSTGTQR